MHEILEEIGLKRSTFFDFLSSQERVKKKVFKKRVPRKPEEEERIIDWLKKKREGEIFFDTGAGYKVLCKYAGKDPELAVSPVNHKRMYSICAENNLLLHRKQKRKTVGFRAYENRTITAPHQLWQFDIKYGHILLQRGAYQFFFLCAFLDVFTKDITGYHIGFRCQAVDILRSLKIALIEEKITREHNLVIRSDNGSQMTSKVFREGIKSLPLVHEFIPPKCPNKNAYIESFFSQVEANVTGPRVFFNFTSAHKTMVEFIEFYRKKRIHGALNMSIEEFKSRLNSLNLADYAVRV